MANHSGRLVSTTSVFLSRALVISLSGRFLHPSPAPAFTWHTMAHALTRTHAETACLSTLCLGCAQSLQCGSSLPPLAGSRSCFLFGVSSLPVPQHKAFAMCTVHWGGKTLNNKTHSTTREKRAYYSQRRLSGSSCRSSSVFTPIMLSVSCQLTAEQ